MKSHMKLCLDPRHHRPGHQKKRRGGLVCHLTSLRRCGPPLRARTRPGLWRVKDTGPSLCAPHPLRAHINAIPSLPRGPTLASHYPNSSLTFLAYFVSVNYCLPCTHAPRPSYRFSQVIYSQCHALKTDPTQITEE